MIAHGFRPNMQMLSARWLLAYVWLLAICFALTVPLTRAQTFKVLHTFKGLGDGSLPYAGVTSDASGNLYGTTELGGRFDFGTVFRLGIGGKNMVLHSFDAADGQYPQAPIIRDSAGNLYGTTYDGGMREGGGCEHGCGTVFTVGSSGQERVLYAFTGGTDGGNPDAGLVQDPAGNLYGTTLQGGSCNYFMGCGVVFKIDSAGTETVLHSFVGGEDGAYPWTAGLLRDFNGNLYGTTLYGGGGSCYEGCGTVFKVDPTGKETILYAFTDQDDGAFPQSDLIADDAGNLYGTTESGGTGRRGTVFKLDKTGKVTVLYAFTGGAGGSSPYAGLVRDPEGNLFGTTYYGGKVDCFPEEGCGVVFKLDKAGRLTVLISRWGPGPRQGRQPVWSDDDGWRSLVLRWVAARLRGRFRGYSMSGQQFEPSASENHGFISRGCECTAFRADGPGHIVLGEKSP